MSVDDKNSINSIEFGGGLKKKHPAFTGEAGPEEWATFVEYYEAWLSSQKPNASGAEKRSWFEQCLKNQSDAWKWYNTRRRKSAWKRAEWDTIKTDAEKRFGRPPTTFDVINLFSSLKQKGDESISTFHDRCETATYKMQQSMIGLPPNMSADTELCFEISQDNYTNLFFVQGMKPEIRTKMGATACKTTDDFLETAILIEESVKAESSGSRALTISSANTIGEEDGEDPYNVSAARGAGAGRRGGRGGGRGRGGQPPRGGTTPKRGSGIGKNCRVCWNLDVTDDSHWGGECPWNPESPQYVARGAAKGGRGRGGQRGLTYQGGDRGRSSRGATGRNGRTYTVADLSGALECMDAWKVQHGAPIIEEMEEGKHYNQSNVHCIGSLRVVDLTESLEEYFQ